MASGFHNYLDSVMASYRMDHKVFFLFSNIISPVFILD